MTCTNLQGQSLCEALADNYKKTLPKGRGGTAWTMETFSQWVKLRYPEVRVVEGQMWGRNKDIYKFMCEDHGEYIATAQHVLNQTGKSHLGSQCPGCKAAKSGVMIKARQDKITAAYVGQTSPDGHQILEHVGYRQTPTHKKEGKQGAALYRYKCNVCGNEEAVSWGLNLKRPGHTTHCGCLSIRDSRLTFSKSQAKANASCYTYLYTVIGGTGVKLGISKNPDSRETRSYEEQCFIARTTRANAWSVEQVLLHRYRKMGLTYDLEDVPAFQSGDEAGGSEVFYSLDTPFLVSEMIDLLEEVETIGWQELLDRYIPVDEMNHRQLFYMDGKRMVQSSGEGYIGTKYRSVFDLPNLELYYV
jgi:hypothetical protein